MTNDLQHRTALSIAVIALCVALLLIFVGAVHVPTGVTALIVVAYVALWWMGHTLD